VFRGVRWAWLAAVVLLAVWPDPLKQSWFLVAVAWPIAWVEWILGAAETCCRAAAKTAVPLTYVADSAHSSSPFRSGEETPRTLPKMDLAKSRPDGTGWWPKLDLNHRSIIQI